MVKISAIWNPLSQSSPGVYTGKPEGVKETLNILQIDFIRKTTQNFI
jgi:hypothetical protein